MFISTAFAATAQGARAADQGGAFPPFDASSFPSQLFWLTICFGLFYLIMSRVVAPRISGILEVRRDRISHDLAEAQRLKEEADAALAAYEQELAEANKKAHLIGAEARDNAKSDADAKRAEQEAKLVEQMAKAEEKISAIKKKALGEVDKIASDTVSEIIRELIGASASKTEITRAISTAGK